MRGVVSVLLVAAAGVAAPAMAQDGWPQRTGYQEIAAGNLAAAERTLLAEHRLQPLQHLDRGGVIGGLGAGAAREQIIGHNGNYRGCGAHAPAPGGVAQMQQNFAQIKRRDIPRPPPVPPAP